MIPKRQFTPYELRQLRRYNPENLDIDSIGDKPIEYVTGHAEFCHHDFLVNQSTLIPRIETEEIVDLISKENNRFSKDKTLTIVDVGSGSGCLGISTSLLLNELGFQKINLFLLDLSKDALKIAGINSSRLLPKSTNIVLINSDLLANFPENINIDILLANLPYIPSGRIPTLDSSVKDFEPLLALDGGQNGTTLINTLLEQLPPHLSNNFIGILEIDHTHLLSDFTLPTNLESCLKKDLFGRTRFLILRPITLTFSIVNGINTSK